ncbi:hypothetical protein D3C71_899840 [compost metagenome]
MQLPNRKGVEGDSYRFNGMEIDKEVREGDGNSYDFGDRIYDPRIGRWLSIDGLTKKFPWWTPYQFSGNTPIWGKDLEGLEADRPVGPANQGIVVDPSDPFATSNTAGGWSLQQVFTKAMTSPRFQRQNRELQNRGEKWNLQSGTPPCKRNTCS